MARFTKKFTRVAAGTLVASLVAATAVAAQGTAINGVVRKIDQSAGKITLKQGPAKSLGMDQGMTMVYRVKDPAMLKQIKVGEKVRFEAEKTANGIVVTRLQKAK